jgi:hypothetical protein
MNWLIAASPMPTFKVTCTDIGNCANKTKTLDMAFTNVTSLIIGLIGMLAVVFIIYGGIQFALSAGDSKKVQQARATLTYAVIGLVLAICAYAVVGFVTGALTSGTVN